MASGRPALKYRPANTNTISFWMASGWIMSQAVSRWTIFAFRIFLPLSVFQIPAGLKAAFFLSDIGNLYLNEKKNEIQKIGEFLIDKVHALDSIRQVKW